MNADLITIEEVSAEDLRKIFALSTKFKRERGRQMESPLAGKSIGLLFANLSTRTRISFEVGIMELGGHSLFLDYSKLQLGRGETIADTARVLSRYLHAVVIRTNKHTDLMEYAQHSQIPVINALTSDFHPCQVLADLFTIYELSGKLPGIKVTFLGDGSSNMANSWILAAKLAGMELTIAAPEEYRPNSQLMSKEIGPGRVQWEKDPARAAKAADYLYTDVWVSMGCESDAVKRRQIFKPYQLNTSLLRLATPGAKVMHCLPAHRGEEITGEVIDGHQAIVFDQAENRLHVQKAILSLLLRDQAADRTGK